MHLAVANRASFLSRHRSQKSKRRIEDAYYEEDDTYFDGSGCSGGCGHRVTDNSFGREQQSGKHELRDGSDG
jgi:hypothetical protein